MSWMQRLYETYERCNGAPQFEKNPLLPVGHVEQQAHIEIVLDGEGNFQRAAVVNKEKTIIPVTENSAGRTSKPVPHPLCDKIQYCAADYQRFGGVKTSSFEKYIEQLRDWQAKEPTPKVRAVLRYLEKGSVVSDLIGAAILHCGPDNKLVTEWNESSPPELFKFLPATKRKRDQGDAFVRWRVQVPGDPVSALWEDAEVRNSWIEFLSSWNQDRGLCMVRGEFTALAKNHPKRLRHGGDAAKLISSNDNSGFTFRGRFENPGQAYGVGSTVTQKAHNALRWLIDRQGYRSGDQVFIAWAVGGVEVPDPFKNTADVFSLEAIPVEQNGHYGGDAGQHFAIRLKKAIAGYRAHLADSDDVVVIGLDSATPGRMAITFYRELTGSEFLDRITEWHEGYSWRHRYSKDIVFLGAPAPDEITEAAYGRRTDEKLRKATVQRLLPCIVDARPLPRDLMDAVVRRASYRSGIEEGNGRSIWGSPALWCAEI
jgi:CRISPR-associated protein Csd1